MTGNEAPSGTASGSVEPRTDRYPPLPDLDPAPGALDPDGEPAPAAPAMSLDLVLDVTVRLSVELGRTEIPIREVVNIGRGSIIELDGAPGDPLDVRVNGVLVGRGEIVVINEERLGLRFVDVVSQAERVSHLR
jgi:flagellar motor switch protein FliN/FliY